MAEKINIENKNKFKYNQMIPLIKRNLETITAKFLKEFNRTRANYLDKAESIF